MVVISVPIHGVEIINSNGKMVFLGGSMNPPLGTNGSESTLVT